MNNQSIKVDKLNEAALDLRAPVRLRLRKGSWSLRLITLISLDYIFLFVAWTLAEYYTASEPSLWYTNEYYLPNLITILIQIGTLCLEGNYQTGRKRYDYWNIIKSLTFAHGLIILIHFLHESSVELTTSELIYSWLFSLFFVYIGRLGIAVTVNYFRQIKLLGRNAVFIICNSQDNEQIISLLNKENKYIIRGIEAPKALDRSYRQNTVEKLKELGVTEVFISWDAIKNRMFLYWLFEVDGITVHILPMELKRIHRKVDFQKIGGMTCINFPCAVITGKDFWIKRTFDFCFTALFLMFTFPIYIAISLAIKMDSPGSIFYRQTRVGLHGQTFQVWKFRTMRADAEKLQKELEALNETKDGILFKIKEDPRITHIGKFLRRYSLDELPQLFNVLCGEMSLVGPRPLPTRDVDNFSESHFIRHEVLPGITGLWQVSGRSDMLDFEQVINLDISYIENWSLRLDFEILLKTISVVLKKEGAY
ncbi:MULTISPECIES: sugar transferase [unclassified Nodularia (in: cyanobacteria)]|uniref:sugar transferase n=1 Tax=unclassified Nodularia (in: cyanobacteria) TaxID=2656917 RepID=UPI00187E5708|nr:MULTISPECIES: sugar transferase [unclassified Nodularia (in: cyanobacteria)]MBE9198537.1 sugar transferase [Nodularia sp. LEGE 06071]MCC2693611.1 sugar transferase [Nodularia sp. LEGE 04288]